MRHVEIHRLPKVAYCAIKCPVQAIGMRTKHLEPEEAMGPLGLIGKASRWAYELVQDRNKSVIAIKICFTLNDRNFISFLP